MKKFTHFDAVVAKDFYKVNEKLKARYEAALSKGTQLVVFLEGRSGTGKMALIERLEKQGYNTCRLPFLNFVSSHADASTRCDLARLIAELPQFENQWSSALSQMIQSQLQNSGRRKGLLIVARSPSDKDRFDHATIRVLSDELQIEKRIVEKSAYIRDPVILKFYEHLLSLEAKQPEKWDAEIDTTSTKQGEAQLLRTLGVPPPTFPPIAQKKT